MRLIGLLYYCWFGYLPNKISWWPWRLKRKSFVSMLVYLSESIVAKNEAQKSDEIGDDYSLQDGCERADDDSGSVQVAF